MNSDQMKGMWKELSGKAKSRWGDLTDDDIAEARGRSRAARRQDPAALRQDQGGRGARSGRVDGRALIARPGRRRAPGSRRPRRLARAGSPALPCAVTRARGPSCPTNLPDVARRLRARRDPADRHDAAADHPAAPVGGGTRLRFPAPADRLRPRRPAALADRLDDGGGCLGRTVPAVGSRPVRLPLLAALLDLALLRAARPGGPVRDAARAREPPEPPRRHEQCPDGQPRHGAVARARGGGAPRRAGHARVGRVVAGTTGHARCLPAPHRLSARQPLRHARVLAAAAALPDHRLPRRGRHPVDGGVRRVAGRRARAAARHPPDAARPRGEPALDRARRRAPDARPPARGLHRPDGRDRRPERRRLVGHDAAVPPPERPARPARRSRHVQHLPRLALVLPLAARSHVRLGVISACSTCSRLAPTSARTISRCCSISHSGRPRELDSHPDSDDIDHELERETMETDTAARATTPSLRLAAA